jgi:hypothetical protein
MKIKIPKTILICLIISVSGYSTLQLANMSETEKKNDFETKIIENTDKIEQSTKNIFSSKDIVNLVIVYIINTIIIHE